MRVVMKKVMLLFALFLWFTFPLSCDGWISALTYSKPNSQSSFVSGKGLLIEAPKSSFLSYRLYLLPFWKRKNAVESTEVSPNQTNSKLEEDWPSFQNVSFATFQKDLFELDQLTPSESSLSSSKLLQQSSSTLRQPKILARAIAWWLRKFIHQRTQYVKGLLVKVSSASNRELLSGKLRKIDIKFDKISFAQLYVSGGGHLIVKGLELTMKKFLFFQNVQSIRRPYFLYADLLFTQEDILRSQMIRRLIQLLVDTILERVFIDKKLLSVTIHSVSLNDRRLQAQGTAKLLSDNPQDAGLASIDFEVSTGAGMRDQGQTLYLRDMQVVLYPESIMRTVMPILTTSPIDIDLGEDCRIDSLVIANKNVWIRVAMIISPIQPFALSQSYPRALYRYDLAAFFSKLLRINGGIAVKWAAGI